MGNANKIIEINGKRYDAVSGQVLGASPSINQIQDSLRSGRSIDGFRRVRRSDDAVALTKRPALKPASHAISDIKTTAATVSAAKKPAPQPVTKHKPHAPAQNAVPHKPQKATTLMRSAVKKPVIKSQAVIKAQTRTDILAKVPAQKIVPKSSFDSVNKVRSQRAVRMVQSPAVSRFGAPQPKVLPKMAVMTAPTTPQPTVTQAVQPPRLQPVRRVSRPVATRVTTAPKTQPNIFEEALAAASDHESYKPLGVNHAKRKRNRALAYLSASVVVLFILGFFAYHNTPQISLKVASYRSGLHAKLPSYEPSGYTFSYLDYQPGNVTVNYSSPSSSQQYNITQKASNWDSQALLSNFVSSADTAYKTYQKAGRTVYVLGNNTATWVDSGIWYTVGGNAALDSSQLLNLASSM